MAKPKTDPEILESFWTLAEGNDQRRLTSAVELIKILDGKQKAHGEGISGDLEYVVKRLVSGLASDRKLARQGFAVVLTQVLRRYDEIDVSYVCEAVKKHLNVKKTETKAERTSIGLGQVIAYLACIQSDKIKEAEGNEVEIVVSKLVNWSQKKAMLSQLCMQGLTQIVSKVSLKTFKKHVWVGVRPLLACGWSTCSSDVLLLMLKIMQCQKIPDSDFKEENWGTSALISYENFESITKVIMDSTDNHPVIHTVCFEVINEAMKDDELFAKFWKNVVSDKLMTGQAAKRYLGFNLLIHCLKRCQSLSQVKVIFSHSVVDCLLNNLTSQKLLYGIAKLVLAEILRFVETCADGQIQVAVLLALIKEPGSIQFDVVTKTNTIGTIMSVLQPEAARTVVSMLMEVMLGKPVLGGLDVSDMDVTRKWALPHLRNLVTLGSMSCDPEWQLHLLEFLLIHAFFEIKEKDSSVPHCVKLNQSFDQSVRHLMQEAFFKALNNLAVHQNQHVTEPNEKRPHKDPRLYIETLYKVLQYAQLLLNKPELVEVRQPMKSKAADQWNNVIRKVDEIRKKVTVDSPLGEGHAFQLLFLHLGLQLFTDPQNAVEVLQDLSTCYDKAFQRKRRMSVKKVDLEEPEWVDVVTELLLSLLMQSSHLVRVVVGNVFSMLVPLITDQSIQLILDVIGSDGKEDEDGPLAFVDKDDENEEEMEDEDSNENEEDEKESSDSSDDEEEEEDEEDEDQMPVDESFRSSIKAALGDAAAKSDDDDNDDEEASDSDMSDAAMERIDHILSEAFRSMTKRTTYKKEAKVKQQQLKHFKLRCLDLLDNLVKHTAPVSKLINLLLPLLRFMEVGLKKKAQKEISDKANSIFNTLCKSKRAYIDVGLDKSTLPHIIRELLEFSTRASGISLVKEIGSAVLFVIRVLQGNKQDSGPSPARTRSKGQDDSKEVKRMKEQALYTDEVLTIIRETLTVFFKKRDSRFNYFLLHDILKRQPGPLFWPLTDDLIEFATMPDVRVFCKTQACSMVTNLMSKNTPSEIGEASWKSSQVKIVHKISQAVLGISEDDIRPKFLQELLLLLSKCSLISAASIQPHFDASLITKVRALSKHVKADTKKICNRFISQVENREKKAKKRPAEGATVTEEPEGNASSDNNNTISKQKSKRKSKTNANIETGVSHAQSKEEAESMRNEESLNSFNESNDDTSFTEIRSRKAVPNSPNDNSVSKNIKSRKQNVKTPKKTPKK